MGIKKRKKRNQLIGHMTTQRDKPGPPQQSSTYEKNLIIKNIIPFAPTEWQERDASLIEAEWQKNWESAPTATHLHKKKTIEM